MMTLKDTAQETHDLVEFTPAEPAKVAPPVDITKINTLHELLALACDDFEKVLADPKYRVNMSRWHMPSQSGKTCSVCLAGSVLAKSAGWDASASYELTPSDYELGARLAALNSLRYGNVLSAYRYLHRVDAPAAAAPALSIQAALQERVARHAHATNREQGRALLKELRVLQGALAEAGI